LGAYQAGALQALKEAGCSFDVISTASIGSLHGLAWNMDQVIRSLDRHWVDNVARRRPFELHRVLRGQNPVQYARVVAELFEAYHQDYPFGQSRAEVLVTVTDYDRCERRVFRAEEPGWSRREQLDLLMASTAIPHLGLPPIRVRGARYCDGAYTSLLPIEPLEAYDVDEIWLIPLFPFSGRGGPRSLSGPAPRGSGLVSVSRRARLLAALARQMAPSSHGATVRPAQSGSGRRGGEPPLRLEGRHWPQHPLRLVRPATRRAAVRLFQPLSALTFSARNVERLLESGRRDAWRAWRRYGSGGGLDGVNQT
jgi:predicted acylesterase/phospholipase RssA